MAHEDMLIPAAKMGRDRRGGHSPKQKIGLTEPRSMCRTIAVSRRRVLGSLRPCQEKIGSPSKQREWPGAEHRDRSPGVV